MWYIRRVVTLARERATSNAGVAQLVEQLIRNQQVIGSSPIAGSKFVRKNVETDFSGLALTPSV